MILERRVNSERESVKMKNGIEKPPSQIDEEISYLVPTKYKVRLSFFNKKNPRSFVSLTHHFFP
jgi:hypothetical protein